MKENILISLMARNNSSYIPYFYKCIDLVEKENKNYNINYIIFTNNNEDNTLELLKFKTSKNFKVVEKNYDKEFLELPRISKLRYLREDFLNIIRKEEFDYLLMMDTDIIFNEIMIRKSIELLKKNSYGAVTANTISGYRVPFYYDDFSLCYKSDWKNKRNYFDYYKFIICNYFNKNHIDVLSAYGGFFITTSKIIKNENLSYIKGNNQLNEDICEHKYFNSQIKNIKFINTITPIYVNKNKNELENSYSIIKKNKEDNRKLYRLLFHTEVKIVLGIILFLFLFFLLKRINS